MKAKESFSWEDLKEFLKTCPTGRTHDVVTRLLKGEKVDLTTYGNAPKKIYSHRAPSYFRTNVKKILKDHKGVRIEGNLVWIPELQSKPKINWTKVV